MAKNSNAENFRNIVKKKIKQMVPNAKEDDLLFSQTKTGYYLEYYPNYPEPHDDSYFVIAQDLNGCITVTGNTMFKYYNDVFDFCNTLVTEYEYLNLVEKLNKYAKAYYEDNEPIITDYEYDMLMQKIKKYEAENPENISKDSLTQKVSTFKESTFEEVEHKVPMLSLQDVFSFEDVADFVEENPFETFSVEQKIDGLSLSVTYENGKLVLAETRGDGYIGENITENAKYISGIPTKLNNQAPETLEVRFEVYLPVFRFDEINEEREKEGLKLYKNPRNAAAGLLRTKDIKEVKKAGLCAFAFNVQRCSKDIASHTKQLEYIESLGIKTVPYRLVTDTQVLEEISNIEKIRNSLPYWIDGAVIKIDSIERRRNLGQTVKYPKWAVAYKYPPEERSTVVRDIILQTGRTGRVTPVAVFDPVDIAGSKVSKATLHNQAIIDKLNVNIGDKIVIRKAAEIIPEVVYVQEKQSKGAYKIIGHTCPSCGSLLTLTQGQEGKCENPQCPAQISRYIEFFVSKECMDIEGMGPTVVEKLINNGLITSPVDIYYLKDKRDILLTIEGFGEKGVDKLLTNIENSKHRNIDCLIKAFGIPGVGKHIGKLLADKYSGISEISLLSFEDFILIPGIGETAANNLVNFFNGKTGRKLIEDLRACGCNMFSSKAETVSDTLTGKTFVITGTLPTLKRSQAQSLIESAGGKVSGSVSKKTDFLLAGENAGSKLEKAQALNIKVISEQDLLDMLSD